MSESKEVKYLIVGGGAAGANGAVGIREIDPEGSVTIIGEETWWPYDRPPLSKGMLLGKVEAADAESKDPSWYAKNNVEVVRGTKAIHLNREAQTVTLADATVIRYQKLLLCTGATPKRLNAKGSDLQGVHLFRRVEDSLNVRDAFKSCKSLILVGAGYIGVEVASGALNSGLEVTILDPTDYPWSKNTSPVVGNFLKNYYHSHGAKLLMNEEVAEILGENHAEGVVTMSGIKVPGDLVVIGIGVSLNVELARSAGLEVDEKNGVIVNEKLQTRDPNIYVAGDIAAFYDSTVDQRWHAEHFLNAKWQGKQAGRNLAGANETYDKVAYFFSDFLDLHMVLRGDPELGKSLKVIGNPADAEFIELYAREDGTLCMGIAFSRDESRTDKIADKLEELIRAKTSGTEITEGAFA